MINLAGHKNPDPIVEGELFVAGIEIVRADVPDKGEVGTKISGRLGNIILTRAWYYWVARGDIPLEVAHKMYSQEPYGRRDVRVGGHCGCPSPDEYGTIYKNAEGKTVAVLSDNDRALFVEYHAGRLDKYMAEILTKLLASTVFVDTKEQKRALATSAVVDLYHIDSQAGLKVFVDAMR